MASDSNTLVFRLAVISVVVCPIRNSGSLRREMGSHIRLLITMKRYAPQARGGIVPGAGPATLAHPYEACDGCR
jgi:hypothetical protein